MDRDQENGLKQAASSYLRSARQQPVDWREWGPEAFAEAQREDKPVLLDIGAVWCHWCHVMDRESYEDTETAAVINDLYIAVKVDRDERPDVDTRYQAAVATISGQGGWPLTAFLTPQGLPFFGGTYFPPEERYGRPSFRRVLLTMAEAFRERRAEVEESAGSVMEAIQQNESFSAPGEEPGAALLQTLLAATMAQFDAVHGGFGSQPKFPHAGALDLLLDAAGRAENRNSTEDPAAEDLAAKASHIVSVTLERMAAGGMYDQLAGGFHRYSVDERWHVPHFEKMAYDNSELLKNYAHAWQSFAEPRFADVANDILRWMDEWLSDREHGGFYASQDADLPPEDDGDYFTWTEAEAGAVLSAEELQAARLMYGLRPVGDMHHNPAKNVLERRLDAAGLAAALGISASDAEELVTAVRGRLYAERLHRPAPFVDRTVYTGWNGMCISAYLVAGRALGLRGPVEFALRSLDRVLGAAWDPGAGLAHVVAYGEGTPARDRVAGVLEDYAFLALAALDGFEASGEMRYFNAARELGDAMLARFYDPAEGGFFDTEPAAGPGTALGALSARRKPLQDAPTPAGNPVAATVLLRLGALTGESVYEAHANATLQAFAGVVEHYGLYAASYGLALRLALEPAVQVCVIGEDELADELAAVALRPYAVNRSVLRLRREQLATLPPVLAETPPHLPGLTGSMAVVCRGNTCFPPVFSAAELRAVL